MPKESKNAETIRGACFLIKAMVRFKRKSTPEKKMSVWQT